MSDLRTVELITECRDALAEELSAWDIDPPLHHVKQAHEKCVAWLSDHALAQQAEPVAWIESPHGAIRANPLYRMTAPQSLAWNIPLYTHPPRREWQGLTEEEINELPGVKGVWWPASVSAAVLRVIRAADEKLKEKNHG
jgi:hypothetical protein